MTQFSDIGAAAVAAVKDKDFAKDLSRAMKRDIQQYGKSDYPDDTADQLAGAVSLMRWDAPHECKECGK